MEIKRDIYLQKLINKESNDMVKVVTGMRRVGKSYLLFQLFYEYLRSKGIKDKHIIKIILDDINSGYLREKHALYDYIKSKIVDKDKKYYVLLDEIQFVEGFSEVLNSLLHIPNVDTYVTGSNSKFLSSDILTEFRGRGDEIRVHPLSFKEFVSGFDGSWDEALDEFFTYGSLPQILKIKDESEKKDYLSSLFEKVYLKDILDRHRVRNQEELDELLDIISSAIGSYTNPTKLMHTFKTVKNKDIRDTTLKKYIGYFEDSFLISKAKKYDLKRKRYINTLSKYYFEDIGLRNARLNFRQVEESHCMENIIYNELKIRGYSVDIGIVETFSKDSSGTSTRNNYEVDFVVNKGSQKIYIQSALMMPSLTKEQQELKSLRNISDSFKKLVVVRDNIKLRRNTEGIETIGLIKFLLEDEWE